jgi:hypothetical protein
MTMEDISVGKDAGEIRLTADKEINGMPLRPEMLLLHPIKVKNKTGAKEILMAFSDQYGPLFSTAHASKCRGLGMEDPISKATKPSYRLLILLIFFDDIIASAIFEDMRDMISVASIRLQLEWRRWRWYRCQDLSSR